MVDDQQVSVDLVYELRCYPAQGHPNLVLCYIVVILWNNRKRIFDYLWVEKVKISP